MTKSEEKTMKPIEAIAYIKNVVCIFARSSGKAQYYKTLKVAIEALEKQIPKKPIEKDWVMFDVLQERDWFCPICDENMLSYGQPYCSVCGQAIDWE